MLDTYLKLRIIWHPWLEYMMFDALVRAETISVADNANFIAADLLAPAHFRKGRIAQLIFAATDRKRAAAAQAAAVPTHRIALAMVDCYSGFGDGWTVSPTRLRELMGVAEKLGGTWSPACYVIVDRAMHEDAGTWMFEPP